MRSKYVVPAALVMALLSPGIAAQPYVEPGGRPEGESTPFPGFKIVGNFYYVGTYEVSSYLIDTGAGLILVGAGMPGSYSMIKANMSALGFKTSDIKIMTTTHAHNDHVADFSLFKKDAPNAKVYINERDAPTVEAGGNPEFSGANRIMYLSAKYDSTHGPIYPPVKVDVRTKPGDHIKLGNTDMTVLKAYGHTPGANSFRFVVQDTGKKYNVYIVNMDTINAGVKLLGSPGYPTIVNDVRDTLAQQAKYLPDIWVSSHSWQFNLHDIYMPGDPYKPSRFGDLAAYKAKIEQAQAAFDAQLAEERAATK